MAEKEKAARGRHRKSPVTRGAARVPVVMQLEALECGAACLAMVMAYYGKWVPLEQVRIDCGVSRDGSNARSMLRAARSYGFTAKAYRYEPEALCKSGRFPCIIHWNFNHFVVLDGFRRGKAVLNDPACGTTTVSMEVFDRSFTGICLMIEPGEGFAPSGKPKSVLAFVKKRLKGTRSSVVFAVLTTILSALIGMISPAFSRVFIDRLLTHQSPAWFGPFIAALCVFSGVQLALAAANALYRNRLSGKLAAIGSTTFLWKVLHMPMVFFSQRLAGDIQSRQSANEGIADNLVNTLAPLVLNACMMVFYLVVMLRYSWQLTAVGVLSLVIDAFMARVISKQRINVTRVQQRDLGKLQSATVAGIEMIETIKSSGAENGFFEKWAGYQASVNAQSVKQTKIDQYLGLVPSAVSVLMNAVVLAMGVWFTMRGNFTVGMVTAFQGFLGSFFSPASSLISAGQTLQEMRTQMERVEDVMEYPEDACYAAAGETDSCSKLSGNIEVKDLSFGYARLAEPVVKHLDLKLAPGQCVAFVGTTGCGKSTVAKLLAGLYQPWEGEIRFDGRPIGEISRDVFTSSVAVVDQEIVLFEDTIANNIKMWDTSIEDFEMILAARDAQLHEDIMQREGGYQYRLTENGKDLSGGQRQRLEIARVLAQDPTIVILDEATSALDAKTEHDVVKAIKDRGITLIIIAHRLSTIRDCDEILVMDKGEVVERGTHRELYRLGGRYTELVSTD